MLYADVIVDITAEALDRPFSYIVPESMKGNVVTGSLVMVPFGRRMVKGYVIGFRDKCTYDPDKMKEIAAVVTGEETAEARLIALAAWMSHTYGGVMAQSLRTVLPVRRRIGTVLEKKYILRTAKRQSLTGTVSEKIRSQERG